jgi:hypothetical protein
MSTAATEAQVWEREMALLVGVADRAIDAKTPAGANAPYKIQQRGSSYVVVNNTGVKATFPDRAKALAYLRALYANVPGAAGRADKVKFSGKARQRIPKGK